MVWRRPNFAKCLACWVVLFLFACDRAPQQPVHRVASRATSQPVLTDGDDARTIIANVVAAHGGEHAAARWRCGYVKYRTTGGILPAQLGVCIVEDTFRLPGRFSRVTRMDAEGRDVRMVWVVNDGKGWSRFDNGPVTPFDNNITDRREHPFADFCRTTAIAQPEVQVTKLGSVQIEGRPTVGVRVASAQLVDSEMWFSAQTGLLVLVRKTLPADNPAGPGVVETTLGEYAHVQGAPIPMLIKATRDGKIMLEVKLMEVRFAEKFDDSVFSKP